MQPALTRRQFLRHMGIGAATALLAACAPATPATPAPQPTAASEAAQAPEATAVPKATAQPAKEKLTLTYWVEMDPNVTATLTSYGEISCYKEMEKQTGVHIEFQHPPTGPEQAAEQFNLMVASGKYPDIIETNWLAAPGGPSRYLKEGVILRLNDLIDQQAPNLSKVFADHPDWAKMVRTDEGDMYVFPFLRGDPRLMTFYGPVARGDWLAKLGIETPRTLDDWHAMLTAFKGQDPNGNGKADEIPFSINQSGSKHGGLTGSNAFVGAWGITMSWYQDSGKVKYGPVQPEFLEFLNLMAGWYKEGLLDPDYVSADGKAMDAKWTSQLGSGCNYTGGGIGQYMGLMKDKDPNYKLIGLPYPVLKAGEKPMLGQRDFAYPGYGSAAITTACKRAPEAAAWLDYAYSPQGFLIMNHGIEGLSYTMVDGYPTYTDLIMKNPDGLPVSQAMGQHQRANSGGPFVQDVRYFEQYLQYQEQKDAVKTWTEPTNERLLPPVTPTEDESKKFASIMNDVQTRFEEALDKVITGADPVESWAQVVDQLKQMGIEEATQIRQAALDRYNKR